MNGGLARDLARGVSRWSRRRKLLWFLDEVPRGSSVLLIGVSPYDNVGSANIVEAGLADGRDCVALSYEPVAGPLLGLPTVCGDARQLPFLDDAFDFVVSNAVVEHVGGPGHARVMVAESLRVARIAALHTTPYRWFPIETHTRVPLLHWLPRRVQAGAFARIGRPGFTPGAYWIFDRRGLASLLPGASVRALTPMSIVARWDRNRAP